MNKSPEELPDDACNIPCMAEKLVKLRNFGWEYLWAGVMCWLGKVLTPADSGSGPTAVTGTVSVDNFPDPLGKDCTEPLHVYNCNPLAAIGIEGGGFLPLCYIKDGVKVALEIVRDENGALTDIIEWPSQTSLGMTPDLSVYEECPEPEDPPQFHSRKVCLANGCEGWANFEYNPQGESILRAKYFDDGTVTALAIERCCVPEAVISCWIQEYTLWGVDNHFINGDIPKRTDNNQETVVNLSDGSSFTGNIASTGSFDEQLQWMADTLAANMTGTAPGEVFNQDYNPSSTYPAPPIPFPDMRFLFAGICQEAGHPTIVSAFYTSDEFPTPRELTVSSAASGEIAWQKTTDTNGVTTWRNMATGTTQAEEPIGIREIDCSPDCEIAVQQFIGAVDASSGVTKYNSFSLMNNSCCPVKITLTDEFGRNNVLVFPANTTFSSKTYACDFTGFVLEPILDDDCTEDEIALVNTILERTN